MKSNGRILNHILNRLQSGQNIGELYLTNSCMRFETLKAVLLKIQVFLDVTLSWLIRG